MQNDLLYNTCSSICDQHLENCQTHDVNFFLNSAHLYCERVGKNMTWAVFFLNTSFNFKKCNLFMLSPEWIDKLFTCWIHFYPRPVLDFGYCNRPCLCICQCVCVSVCVCINHLLVRTITHQPFKLESPNLKHRCKTPWFRCLLFWGVIDLELQLESRILPHFELFCAITCHLFKLESPNLDKKCILIQLRSLLIFGRDKPSALI